jgi:anthranilate synthase component 1
MYPDFKQFKTLSKKYNCIPVTTSYIADTITPVSALAILNTDENCFLLESITGGTSVSRYSFLGFGKAKIFKCHDKEITIIEKGKKKVFISNDPLEELNKYALQWKYPTLEGMPIFQGGGVGYISYDMFRTVEKLPNCPKDDLAVPDILFGFHEILLAFDHAKRTMTIIVHADLMIDKPEVAYEKAKVKINETLKKLKKAIHLPLVTYDNISGPLKIKYDSNVTRKEFIKNVKTIKEHIKAGDIFQCVLSQRLETKLKASPLNVYRALRAVNPSPYMFYLKFDDFLLLGSSPEILVSVDQKKKVTVRPIAGTRHRGTTEEEDLTLAKDLLDDPKEIAEHTMLVDLARNDIGRVANYKSIMIEERMIVEYYSHVMHIVSTVSGKLKPNLNIMHAFKACFPAGTLTGAPKIRAMQILDKLETTKRGPFGGGVGYIDYRGHLDTCITIRTILLKNGKAYVQAGAGIVADSVPESEYQETLNKTKGMLKAIEVAEAAF